MRRRRRHVGASALGARVADRVARIVGVAVPKERDAERGRRRVALRKRARAPRPQRQHGRLDCAHAARRRIVGERIARVAARVVVHAAVPIAPLSSEAAGDSQRFAVVVEWDFPRTHRRVRVGGSGGAAARFRAARVAEIRDVPAPELQ